MYHNHGLDGLARNSGTLTQISPVSLIPHHLSVFLIQPGLLFSSLFVRSSVSLNSLHSSQLNQHQLAIFISPFPFNSLPFLPCILCVCLCFCLALSSLRAGIKRSCLQMTENWADCLAQSKYSPVNKINKLILEHIHLWLLISRVIEIRGKKMKTQ